MKFGRCIKELDRIYGVREGRPEKLPQNAEVSNVTQEDLASQLGFSVDTLKRYKDLADAIPEIQTLVETGIVTPTTARPIHDYNSKQFDRRRKRSYYKIGLKN